MKERIDTKIMEWSDINDIQIFTENNEDNKTKRTKRTSLILLGAIQFVGNYVKGIKQLNAYDSSSIIKSDSTWLQKHFFKEYRDENDKTKVIEIGQVCYLDYGKTYQGELPYCHYGLCIGRKEGKLLIIPITSATTWRTRCYHPTLKPKESKQYRQALNSEGFSKDCVLLMNDTKFISAGRIIDLDVKIEDKAILQDIQNQLFSVCLPDMYQLFNNMNDKIEKLNKQLNDKNELIVQLKNTKNTLEQKLKSQSNVK